jgi:putative Holliday junction resolvase
VALDVGDRTIGVAASDELGITANPVRTIRRGASVKADLREVDALLAELEASEVVVGIPLDAEGEEGPQAAKVKDFSERLAKRLRIPVVYWDERFSTAEAEETLIEMGASRARRRKVIDKMAAAVILESYMRRSV